MIMGKKETRAGIVGWSKTMIEKQRVPGSSPAWKRKEFFQPCCDPQLIFLIGNSWPGTRVTWMQLMGFRSLTTLWSLSLSLSLSVWSTHLPPVRRWICVLILEVGGVPADAKLGFQLSLTRTVKLLLLFFYKKETDKMARVLNNCPPT